MMPYFLLVSLQVSASDVQTQLELVNVVKTG